MARFRMRCACLLLMAFAACATTHHGKGTTSTGGASGETSTGSSSSSSTGSSSSSSTGAILETAPLPGFAYERDADVHYDLAPPVTPAVGGAGVTYSTLNAGVETQTASTTTAADGTFTLTMTEAAVGAASASAAGFAATRVTTDFALELPTSMPLGMYRTAAASARPGFVKGAVTWDSGGWTVSVFFPSFESTYARLQNVTHAGLVSFCDTPIVTDYDATHVTMSTLGSSVGAWDMLTAAQYQTIVGQAHAHGLQFLMWLSVNAVGANYYSDLGSKDAGDSVFWSAWFAAYQAIAVQYAQIAQANGVEYLGLALNLGYVIRLDASYWSTLIAAIRASGYTGKIVAGLYTDPERSNFESDQANGGTPAPFLSLFNAVILDIYAFTFDTGYTRTALQGIVTDAVGRAVAGGANDVWIMLGTPATDTAVTDGTFIEPLAIVNPIAGSHARDLYAQADAYQATFEAINTLPAVGGFLTWGFHYRDDYLSGYGARDLAMDKAASVRGKPAEAVMRWWYDSF